MNLNPTEEYTKGYQDGYRIGAKPLKEVSMTMNEKQERFINACKGYRKGIISNDEFEIIIKDLGFTDVDVDNYFDNGQLPSSEAELGLN